MKQTAVKWMANELLHLDHEFDMKLIDKNEYQTRRKQVTKQAKQMEKEQIIDCFNQGYTQCSIEDLEPKSRERFVDAKDYYNKTFKSE